MYEVFSDQEHRILLAALGRERKVCEKIDKEDDSYMLREIMDSIEAKVHKMQHPRTVGDRIRGMSDDELAELLQKAVFCGGLLNSKTSSETCRSGCKDGFCGDIKYWLQSTEIGIIGNKVDNPELLEVEV